MSQISSLPNSGVTDSPLITPGTASTSSVKPDAAPKFGRNAGQPAPTTLHNLQNAGCLRMQEMARVAVDRAGGLPCLEGNTLDRVTVNTAPRYFFGARQL